MRLHFSRLARAAILAAALSVTFATRPARATVVVPITRAELVDRSDLVVRATVLDRRTSWNQDHTQVVSLTRLRVQSYLKGAGVQDLTLRQYGGAIDGFTMVVPGDATLRQGQDVVLFLRRGDGVVFLTALAMAAYYVVHSPGVAPTVWRDLHDLTFARQQGGRMVLSPAPVDDASETLDHLAAEVVALAAGAR